MGIIIMVVVTDKGAENLTVKVGEDLKILLDRYENIKHIYTFDSATKAAYFAVEYNKELAI